MKTKNLLFTLFLAVAIAACEKDETVTCTRNPDPAMAGSCEQIRSTSPLPDNGANISSLAISGNCLDIALSYGGGCTTHQFDLVWDGAVLESFPPQVNLHLKHDSNADPCDAIIFTTESFRLNKVRLPGYSSVILHVFEPGASTAKFSILYNY